MASKVFLALLFPLIYMGYTAFYALDLEAITVSCVLALIGFFVPNAVLLHLRQQRQNEIIKALPDALDLMVVCVEAGLGLDMTFKRVGDEIRDISKELSDEFYLTNLEVRAGMSRDDSFKNMALRCGVSEVHNLMTILAQTSRFGTSVAQALRVHSDAMRIKRRLSAEEQAAKTTVKLVFPLVMFILPALLIVLVGPAAIRIVLSIFPVLGGR
jgi:tight adherence protein C